MWWLDNGEGHATHKLKCSNINNLQFLSNSVDNTGAKRAERDPSWRRVMRISEIYRTTYNVTGDHLVKQIIL